uniref:Dynein light chain Tctex-type family member 5 n=1 Tax=Cynoglossus semilaevis TaxID=244447 RepID=A0A3P8VKQ6_CYNSE
MMKILEWWLQWRTLTRRVRPQRLHQHSACPDQQLWCNSVCVSTTAPHKRFPVPAVTHILKDVLSSYLQQEKYEVEWSQKMTKTICEVIRARVKDLMIPRYKIVVLVHIGQQAGQSMQMSSRCLWDATTDSFACYSFTNSSLFGVATVYGVYFE